MFYYMVSKNGWSLNELYQLPVTLRDWYFEKYGEEVEKTAESMESDEQ